VEVLQSPGKTIAALRVASNTLHEVFGSPDDVKFCSSMTLFAIASGGEELF